jgi:hypothetical protein
MSRALHADQSAIVKSSTLSATMLVKLVTYSDRGAGTVASTHYLSKDVVIYDYGNTGTDQVFKPWLQSISALRAGMVNVPGGSGSGVTVNSVTVTLENSIVAHRSGERVSATILADNLEGASIEISELLKRSEPERAHDDQSALDGDEHTVWFRGRVRRRVVSHEQIDLICETVIPTYTWPQMTNKIIDIKR